MVMDSRRCVAQRRRGHVWASRSPPRRSCICHTSNPPDNYKPLEVMFNPNKYQLSTIGQDRPRGQPEAARAARPQYKGTGTIELSDGAVPRRVLVARGRRHAPGEHAPGLDVPHSRPRARPARGRRASASSGARTRSSPTSGAISPRSTSTTPCSGWTARRSTPRSTSRSPARVAAMAGTNPTSHATEHPARAPAHRGRHAPAPSPGASSGNATLTGERSRSSTAIDDPQRVHAGIVAAHPRPRRAPRRLRDGRPRPGPEPPDRKVDGSATSSDVAFAGLVGARSSSTALTLPDMFSSCSATPTGTSCRTPASRSAARSRSTARDRHRGRAAQPDQGRGHRDRGSTTTPLAGGRSCAATTSRTGSPAGRKTATFENDELLRHREAGRVRRGPDRRTWTRPTARSSTCSRSTSPTSTSCTAWPGGPPRLPRRRRRRCCSRSRSRRTRRRPRATRRTPSPTSSCGARTCSEFRAR